MRNTDRSLAESSGAASEPEFVTASPRRWRFRIASVNAIKRLAILAAVIVLLLIYAYRAMIVMPGRSYSGPLPKATDAQQALARELREYVEVLSDATGGVGRVGNRSMFYPKRFAASAVWIHDQLNAIGFSDIHEYPVERGSPVPNLEVVIPGTKMPAEIIVVGAHYDAFQGSPGADDNASGVAACLYLARRFKLLPQARTLKIVFFVNEEPPAFWTADMGSWVYAKACRARKDNIVAMLSIESIGYYSDAPGSQRLLPPMNRLYPTTGNYIAFVSNYSSRSLNKRAIKVFRDTTQFPSEGGSPPEWMPGVGWSDHWSFWQEGFRAFMITDTATFRHPSYHTPFDNVDKMDFDRMSRVVEGIERVVTDLASGD